MEKTSLSDIEPKNRFHICPITNETKSTKNQGRVENRQSEELGVYILNRRCLISLTGSGERL